MDKFQGVPYGLFLGPKVSLKSEHTWLTIASARLCRFIPYEPVQKLTINKQTIWYWFYLQELKEVGGTEELEKEIKKRIRRREALDAIQ